MKRVLKASVIAGVALVLVACNPIKFIQKKVEQILVKADPEVLEVHANQVSYSLKGKFPPKVFHKKAYVTLTPVVEYNGKELKLDSKKYRGEKTEGEGSVISFSSGGAFKCEGTFPYTEDMAGKEATVRLDIEVCKNPETCTTLKKENLAKGFITTSQLIANDDEVFFAGFASSDNGKENAASVGSIPRRFKRTIFFELNRYNVRTSEKKSERMNELWSFVATPRLELKGVAVNSFASPDGELKLNQNLTDKRSNSTYNFLAKELKGLKIDAATELYKRQAMEEDWAGLKARIAASSYADKNEALQIIGSSKSNDDKEDALRKLDSWDDIVANVMPQLRRSDVSLTGVIKNRSLEELKELAKASYDDLTWKELLIYAASTKDLDKKKEAYQAIVKAKPKSAVGYNNLAAVYILKGDLNKAKSELDRGISACGDNDTFQNNYGVIYRRNGDIANAQKSYDRAKKAGIQIGYNQAIINTIQGDYSSASANLPSSACGSNACLINILSGNLDNAVKVSSCSNGQTALGYYVEAVAYARKKDLDNLSSNLRSAVKEDKSFADKATNDLEFRLYWDSDEFKNAVNR